MEIHADERTLVLSAGSRLPGGTYRLGTERHDRLVAALGGVAPADGAAHPVAAWVIGMGGMGLSLEELFAAVGVHMDDGPMLGGHETEIDRPLQPEMTYTVTGEIASIESKTGRRMGRFDVMRVELQILEPDGRRAATCVNIVVLPRGGPA